MAVKRRIRLKIQGDHGKVVVRLNGYLDGSGACQVDHALQRLQETSKGCRLSLDLGGIRNFEYFGIAILAKSIKSQRSHFEEIILTGLQASTENVFKRFGLPSTTAASC